MAALSPRDASGDDTYEVIIVRYGTRSTTRSDVFLNYGIYGEPNAPIEMDYFLWVVRNDRRTVLVDTGFSARAGASRSRRTLIAPELAYRLLGIESASAPAIVLTHAHYDHTGNVRLFPRSDVHMSRSEYEFWTGPNAAHDQFRHVAELEDIDYLVELERNGRLHVFDDQLALAPGIEVFEVGGHTPGQSVVAVRTTAGVTLLASDAVHYYEEVERDMPFTIVADLMRMYEGLEFVRRSQREGLVQQVVAGHDPGTLARFTEVHGPLQGLAASIGGTSGQYEGRR